MGWSELFGLKDVWKEGYYKLGDKYLALLKECAAIKTELKQSDNALRRVNGDYFETRAERDRLAAENAELRKTVAETEQACSELSDDLSQMYQLELEAKCHGDLEESHKIMVDVVVERDAELAAANATLDALRALCGPNKTISNSTCMKMVDLLYPQPMKTLIEDMHREAQEAEDAGCSTWAGIICDWADRVETLLEREAEVLAAFDRAYLASKSESASNSILALYKDCKAILDPQPAALAEEKNNAD